MHAVCQDSFPPCIYMSDTSHAVASLVHQYNEIQISKGNLNNKVCYTFDAGPNACLFVPGAVANEMLSLLLRTFPPSSPQNADSFIRGMKPQTLTLSKELESIADENAQSGRLKYLIHTKVGEGPRVLTEDGAHLLDPVSGLPTESGGMA
ncbi:diphosphomevalonate decarboxylase-like [Penaeus monodon]|nr:diphosphomevalonate decarboxylase-like [Penaeus monodon]